jgi:hypothetical protein
VYKPTFPIHSLGSGGWKVGNSRQNVRRNPSCALRKLTRRPLPNCGLVSTVVIVQFGRVEHVEHLGDPSSATRCGKRIFCWSADRLPRAGCTKRCAGPLLPRRGRAACSDDSGPPRPRSRARPSRTWSSPARQCPYRTRRSPAGRARLCQMPLKHGAVPQVAGGQRPFTTEIRSRR